MNKLMLNGEWQLTYNTLGCREEKWNRWIPAIVPGDVHLDLMRAGLICEPLISDNSKKQHWIEEKEWWYKRTFTVPEALLGNKVELVCDGLDLTADIWLNGRSAGHANNMFVQHRFDVTNLLQSGENEILVRLDVGFAAVGDVDTDKFAKSWGRDEPRRPWMRKAQQAFYWDIAPRLLTCGIWRDIYLESFDEVILRDVYVTSVVEAETAVFTIDVELEAAATTTCQLEVTIEDADTRVKKTVPLTANPGYKLTQTMLTIENSKLWWPNGMGEPHLYQVSIRLLNEKRQPYGEKTIKHGIRTLTIEQEPLNDKEKTFTVVVNGCKVFSKGGNWVPSDAIYARINRETEYRLLKYAQEANFNMIRVWGGGVYPDPFFYEICDELGIMVWQDFMYACAYYPDDEPQFCQNARIEAEKIVRKFRNHASLAIWCGNNETYWMHNRVNPEGVFYGFKIYDDILPDVCRKLAPQTYYHPSSPYPGPANEQQNEGDQHIWSYVLGWYELNHRADTWDYSEAEKATVMQLWNVPELNYKFVSEFGLYSPSNQASLQKFMGEHPVVIGSSVYNHHRNHFEADFILEMLRRYYKRRDDYSLAEFAIAGQALQAEVIKYIFEEFRSRMFVCSGMLFWEYNDTWGHVGYAPVDYYLNVKPIYHYMQRAFAHLHVVFKGWGKQVWLLNDTPQNHEVEIEYGALTFTGEPLFSKRQLMTIAGCTSLLLDSVEAELAQVADPSRAFLFARLYDRQGQLLDRNRQFLRSPQELNLPQDSMAYEIEKLDGQTWEVHVSAEAFVWMVKIDADENLRCSDNAFDLWPGERKTVRVCTEQVYPHLALRVENVNQYVNL